MPQTKQNIVSLEAWTEKRKTRMLPLPSGMTVEIVENAMLPLITNSLLPLSLLAKAQKMGAPSGSEVAPEQEKIIDGYNKLLSLITEVVVSPKITLTDFARIPAEDTQALIAYLMRGKEVAALGSFRRVSDGADAGPDVREVRTASV